MVIIVILKILEIKVTHWPTNTNIFWPAGLKKWAVDDEN
jgi:hypothetical protein